MKAETLNDFTGRYSLSKTLRFELKPQGKTKEHIEAKGLLSEDENRAENYKKVKKLIDEYHKNFIERALDGLQLEGIKEFEHLYNKSEKTDEDKKELESLKAVLRKQIAERFSKNENREIKDTYQNLFSKELIREDLKSFVKKEEDKKLIDEFREFTTYFTGFHENRKNIYTHEEKSTAIAYRLIHENLPKFLDNLKVYRDIQKSYPDLSFAALETELEEVLQGTPLDEVFTLEFFNRTLTQKGIDFYNIVLGGKSEEKKKLKGLNEYINLYRQKNHLKLRQLPNLKPLYKQILSDRESISFLPETFEADQEVLDSIGEFYLRQLIEFEKDGKHQNVIQAIKSLLDRLPEFDLEKVYIKNGAPLTHISQKLFGDWSIIGKALEHYYEEKLLSSKGKNSKAQEEKKEKWVARSACHSIAVIHDALLMYSEESDVVREKLISQPVCTYFANMEKAEEDSHLLQKIEDNYKEVKDLLNTEYPQEKNLAQDKDEVAKIKSFLDSLKELLHFIKPLLPKDITEKDEAFYTEFTILYDQLDLLTPLYNKTRNYLTRKPYSVEKVKLNFENSTLLDGWDVNKETDNTSVLLRKDGLYYLAIMDKKYNKLFKNIPEKAEGEAGFEKVVYKLLPGANKMLPKVFFSKKNIDYYQPSFDILSNYKKGTHKKGAAFSLQDCHNLIDFFKASINKHHDWKKFDFSFSDTKTYEDMSGFYREVEQQGYKLTFQNIPESYINELVEEGKLYLFQIYNKDFSPYSKGKPNLHTLYWKALFDKDNLKDVVYKLNGQAEVFFRKKSLNYDERTLKQGHHAEMLKDKFDYPIISNRRFAFDKFQFHVPVTLNFKAKGSGNINGDVLEFLQNNPDINIIGIDRGERHLLYLTLIDRAGNIKAQYSLNEIISQYKSAAGKTVEVKTSYHKKLHEKEEQREDARKTWNVIENIKELKEGYLSQVVHQIARMMAEQNAIVVMEDLNIGFKRGRQKVEKQVYQKFEKMLIDKLNYLVFKDKGQNEQGGVLKALQLSNKFESFRKMGKQSGFIFYVPAALTSKIDPATGFVNFLYPKYESVEKSKAFFEKFDAIRFNPEKRWFEFSFDYNNFTARAEGSRTEWTVCTTHSPRYRWNRSLNNNHGGAEAVNITEKLETLLVAANIDYAGGGDIKPEITGQEDKNFFKELTALLAATVSLRHNNGKTGAEEQDVILSPVADSKGKFFNSLEAANTQPQNADANGAYHIALKGLWMLEQIDKADDLRKVKLAISNKEWLQFAQGRSATRSSITERADARPVA